VITIDGPGGAMTLTRHELRVFWKYSGLEQPLPGSIRRAVRVLLSELDWRGPVIQATPASALRVRLVAALRVWSAPAVRACPGRGPIWAPGCSDAVLRHGPPAMVPAPEAPAMICP
jgi:hypothetical protein